MIRRPGSVTCESRRAARPGSGWLGPSLPSGGDAGWYGQSAAGSKSEGPGLTAYLAAAPGYLSPAGAVFSESFLA
jgi:hypothetical protein